MIRLLRQVPLLSLMASAVSLQAATPSAWQTGIIESGKSLSLAGIRAMHITIDSGLDAAGAEQLRLDLFGRDVVARRRQFESTRDGWNWTGQLDGEPGHFVVLSSVGGHHAGLIHTAEGRFEIRPGLTAGTAFLIELDSSAFPACGGAVEAPALSPESHASAVADAEQGVSGSGQVEIDVLVLYTSTLMTALGGVNQVRAQAQAAVAASNTSFSNSDMSARFVLVETLPSPIEEGPTGSNITSEQLSTLRNNLQVQSLRNDLGADMVALMVNDGSSACGIGYVMRSPGSGFSSSAYQITASGCAVGNLSYAHEHGHNMGMEHDPPNGTTPTTASYPWSFGHTVSGFATGNYRTVMAYASACSGSCPRVAYFSNPEINYQARPTGAADVADNHRTGNSTAPIVAAFRQRNRIFANGFD